MFLLSLSSVPAAARADEGCSSGPPSARLDAAGDLFWDQSVLVGAPTPRGARVMSMEKIRRALWYPVRHATFEPSTRRERRVFRRLVAGVLAETSLPEPDAGRWRSLARLVGYRIAQWRHRGTTFWALLERSERQRGGGAYVFRLGPASLGQNEIVLQAPHAIFDRRTGHLAAAIFFQPRAVGAPRALFTNTIPRYRDGAPGEPAGPRHGPADVCHNPRHLFTAATEGAAMAIDRLVVLQLHGYANASVPKPEGGSRVHAIVSAGDRTGSSPASAAVAAQLETLLGDGVRRYPEQTRHMGGTRNVLARRLRATPGASFVHIETSATLRRQLHEDATLRARFGALLLSAASAGKPTVCQLSL